MKQWMKAMPWLVAVMAVAMACQKEVSEENGANTPLPGTTTQSVSIFLTDDPGLFDSVVVNILSLKAQVDTCKKDDDDDDDDDQGANDDSCKAWYNLALQPGFYDILSLRNGLETLLANGSLPAGTIRQLKIELGANHFLVKDGIRYPLNLPPGRGSEVEIKLKHKDWDDLANGRRQIWLDFDVARSVIKVRDGEFYLQPVIRPFTVRKTGSIEGTVLPPDAQAVLSIFNSTDTAYALPNRKGDFKVRGLKAGDYSLFVNAGNGYADTTITGIQVTTGKETKIATLRLRK